MTLRNTLVLCFALASIPNPCAKKAPPVDGGADAAKVTVSVEVDAGIDEADAESADSGHGGHADSGHTKWEVVKDGGADPLAGRWTLADATRGIRGKGGLLARLDTTRGMLECKMFEDRAPNTVANFVGLARGLRPWKDPDGRWVKRPAFDGTPFHRLIRGLLIQGGDAKKDGTGDPGFTIPDEIWGSHDRVGLLCMFNRGKNTNGSQFFILDAPARHLDRGYTIFAQCGPESLIHDIANGPTLGDRALNPVTIRSVSFLRETPE